MERRIINLMVIGLVALSSCYYDSEENLYPPTDCITTNLSLQEDIVPILERNCFACHSATANTANITLEGHDELMKHVNSGKLLGAIRHDPGFKPMPQGAGKLIDCDIAKIEKWIEAGSHDN